MILRNIILAAICGGLTALLDIVQSLKFSLKRDKLQIEAERWKERCVAYEVAASERGMYFAEGENDISLEGPIRSQEAP